MKMNRIHDDEQGTTTFRISGFEVEAKVFKGALPDSLLAVQLEDKGGVIEGDVVHSEVAEARAVKMLWNFFHGHAEGTEEAA
jgi:hypothetical protein